MKQTPEQKAAQEALQAAIEQHRKAFTDAEDVPIIGEITTDWITVAACISYDDDGDQTVAYHWALSNGAMPDHTAKGLLVHALDMVEKASEDEGR